MTKHTPGPYFNTAGLVMRHRDDMPVDEFIGTLSKNLTRDEQEQLTSLLNKGTHFKEMLAALHAAMKETAKYVAQGDGYIGALRDVMEAAIANAEPTTKDEGEPI